MSLKTLAVRVSECDRCPRLRNHCKTVAKAKKRQFKEESYWGKPVPGFGDSLARVLVVGLAPAAHGANRTGRMFTGDQSGLWLYRALHKSGFSNQKESVNRMDGLTLKGVYITAIARCAPPGNQLQSEEIENCSSFLVEEISLLREVQIFLALGQVALKGLWRVLPEGIKPQRAVPKFCHGGKIDLKDGRRILFSYHPSQQNTFTGKLTEPMFDKIFQEVRIFLQS